MKVNDSFSNKKYILRAKRSGAWIEDMNMTWVRWPSMKEGYRLERKHSNSIHEHSIRQGEQRWSGGTAEGSRKGSISGSWNQEQAGAQWTSGSCGPALGLELEPIGIAQFCWTWVPATCFSIFFCKFSGIHIDCLDGIRLKRKLISYNPLSNVS